MAIYVPSRKVWTRQPQFGTEIDRNNHFGKHLVALINPAAKWDCVYGNPVEVVGNVNFGTDDGGVYSAANTNFNNHALVAGPTGISTGNLSDFCIVSNVPLTSWQYACGSYDGGSLGAGISVYHATEWKWFCGNNFTGGGAVLSSLSGIQFLVGTRRGTVLTPYRNGKVDGTTGTGSGDVGANLRFVQDNLGYNQNFSSTARVYLSGRFDIGLTAEEVAEFYKNPWQIFKPRRSWFALAGAESSADLAGDAASTSTATGAITSQLAMASAAVAVATATGVVNQTVGLTGSAASISVADGVVTITTTLSGDGFVEAFASGFINQAMAITGGAQSSTSATGELQQGDGLLGDASIISSATGSIGMTMTLSGDAVAQALASATFASESIVLAGDAQSAASATGALLIDVPMIGNAIATVTGSAGMTQTQTLEASAAVVASCSGDVTLNAVGLSGDALAQVIAGGSIQFVTQISAAALAQATAQMINVSAFASDRHIEKWTMRPSRTYSLAALARNYTLAATA